MGWDEGGEGGEEGRSLESVNRFLKGLGFFLCVAKSMRLCADITPAWGLKNSQPRAFLFPLLHHILFEKKKGRTKQPSLSKNQTLFQKKTNNKHVLVWFLASLCLGFFGGEGGEREDLQGLFFGSNNVFYPRFLVEGVAMSCTWWILSFSLCLFLYVACFF